MLDNWKLVLTFGILGLILQSGCLSSCGVEDYEVQMKPVKYYLNQLENDGFVWNGPTSSEDRIPTLHAARALAYIGDEAVPGLLDALGGHKTIDKESLLDALSEIGIPITQFREDLMLGDVRKLRIWWKENRESTLSKRTEYRKRIGLPSPR